MAAIKTMIAAMIRMISRMISFGALNGNSVSPSGFDTPNSSGIKRCAAVPALAGPGGG